MEEVQYHLLAAVEERHWWHRALRREVSAALARYGGGVRLELLDAGCGTGGLAAALAARHRVVGMDLSPLALAYGRGRGLERLARASVEALPFAGDSFDAAISIDVLSHRSIRSDAAAARELSRVLRPGGILILQLSAFERLRGEHDESVHQDRRYSRAQVLRLLAAAELEPLSCRYRLAFLPPLMLLNNLLHRLRPARRRPDIALPSPPVNRLLRAAAWADGKLGARSPVGSSVFCVARRSP